MSDQQQYQGSYCRAFSQSQEWTPHSAVSSFNLPVVYDSSLITPVSMNGGSPMHDARPASNSSSSRPDQYSMHYQYRDFGNVYYNSADPHAMKWKEPSQDTAMSQADTNMSLSPYVFDSPQTLCPPTPYWGSFSVSGTQNLSSPSTSTSSNSFPTPRSESFPSSTEGANQAPLLIKPTPSTLRSSFKRQYSGDNAIRRSVPQGPQQPQQVLLLKAEPSGPMQLQSQPQQHAPAAQQNFHHSGTPPLTKSSLVPREDSRGQRTPSDLPKTEVSLRRERALKHGDELLIALRNIRPRQKWQSTLAEYNRQMVGIIPKPYKESALQMKYKRAVESVRVWTPKEIKALHDAKQKYKRAKWESIAMAMRDEYGVHPKWSNSACRKKWVELHGDDDDAEGLGSSNMDERDSSGSDNESTMYVQSTRGSSSDTATMRSYSDSNTSGEHQQQQMNNYIISKGTNHNSSNREQTYGPPGTIKTQNEKQSTRTSTRIAPQMLCYEVPGW